MNPGVVARPPIKLSNRLVIDDQSSMRAEIVLPIYGVPVANVQIHFPESAVDFIVRVDTAGNVRAGGSIRVLRALELRRQIENRITRRSIAICIESGNSQARG